MSCRRCKNVKNRLSTDILVGTNKVLIVGESPKGELKACLSSPTLKRLARNLNEVHIDIFKCSFTEICKCELNNRGDFRAASRKCMPKLIEQIITIKPKLVITLGVQSNEVFAEFFNISTGIGKIVTLDNFKYLPLWHTSPINPRGLQRNKEILSNKSLTLAQN